MPQARLFHTQLSSTSGQWLGTWFLVQVCGPFQGPTEPWQGVTSPQGQPRAPRGGLPVLPELHSHDPEPLGCSGKGGGCGAWERVVGHCKRWRIAHRCRTRSFRALREGRERDRTHPSPHPATPSPASSPHPATPSLQSAPRDPPPPLHSAPRPRQRRSPPPPGPAPRLTRGSALHSQHKYVTDPKQMPPPAFLQAAPQTTDPDTGPPAGGRRTAPGTRSGQALRVRGPAWGSRTRPPEAPCCLDPALPLVPSVNPRPSPPNSFPQSGARSILGLSVDPRLFPPALPVSANTVLQPS